MSEHSQPSSPDSLARRKLRTGLVLASVALAIFIGYIVRGWVLGK